MDGNEVIVEILRKLSTAKKNCQYEIELLNNSKYDGELDSEIADKMIETKYAVIFTIEEIINDVVELIPDVY